jgi:hypothetical protein
MELGRMEQLRLEEGARVAAERELQRHLREQMEAEESRQGLLRVEGERQNRRVSCGEATFCIILLKKNETLQNPSLQERLKYIGRGRLNES